MTKKTRKTHKGSNKYLNAVPERWRGEYKLHTVQIEKAPGPPQFDLAHARDAPRSSWQKSVSLFIRPSL